MVLPAGIIKASGLRAVLGPKVETDVVLGVGDAENDHSLFDA
jgi:hydroxymethylpyrimidine pyrophosphatase-like HAD family hydrolase